MSATPADDAQTSPAWNCGCKITIFFWIEQIKKPFMRILHKWQGGLDKYIMHFYSVHLFINRFVSRNSFCSNSIRSFSCS